MLEGREGTDGTGGEYSEAGGDLDFNDGRRLVAV